MTFRDRLRAALTERDTPAANADFDSRAHRDEPSWRQWLWILVAAGLCGAMLLASLECHVRIAAC